MPNQVIPPELSSSVGLMYVVSKGWTWRASGDDQITVETCPMCKHAQHKFYMCVKGNKDGVFMCHRCTATANLRSLQEDLGPRIQRVQSRSECGKAEKKIQAR